MPQGNQAGSTSHKFGAYLWCSCLIYVPTHDHTFKERTFSWHFLQSLTCSRCFVGSLSNTKCLPLTDNYNFLIMNLNLYLNHCNAIILLKLWHLLILQKSPLDIIEKSFDTSSLCLLLNVVGVGILVCFLCPPFCFRCIHKAYTVLSCCLIPKLSCNSAQGLT